MYRVASLSEQGWVSDDPAILNYVFTCYMLSDAAQSLAFQGNVINLPETYYKYINSPNEMASAMADDLTKLLGYYFPQVDVRASAKEISGKHYGILLHAAIITKENERVELSKVLEIDSSNLRKIIEVNNYGDGEAVLTSL